MSDDELRQLAHDARSEVEAALDVDEAWTRLRSARSSTTLPPELRRHTRRSEQAGPSGRRRRAVVGIGLTAAAVIGLVAWSVWPGDDDSIQITEPATTVPAATTPTADPAPTTVAVEPSRTDPDVTVETLPPSSVASSPATSVIPLDTSALPRAAPVDLLARLALEVGEPPPQVAVGELGVLLYRSTRDFVTIIRYTGEVIDVPIAPDEIGTLANVVYGPGDVMYGLRPILRDGVMGMAMQAVSLSGGSVGEVVAESDDLGLVRWVELPPDPFGHGIDGVVARVRDTGSTLIGYVDENGDAREYEGLVPDFLTADETLRITSSSGPEWQLEIDGQQRARAALSGYPGAAPSNGQRAVYVTNLSESEEVAGADVIAVLEADGTGEWLTVSEGWVYGASDAWGTAFTRLDGNVLEVALLAGGPTDWRRAGYESARISSECTDGAGCPALLIDRDGTPISYEPRTRLLTRHSVPALTAAVPADYGDPFLEVAGPEGVVYVNVDPRSPGELNADLVAVVIEEGGLREVGRWDDAADKVGDSDLVTSPAGMVLIGCCGPDAVRPSPDAETVVRWVDAQGEVGPTLHPAMRVEIEYPVVTVVRTNEVPRTEVTWTVDIGETWTPRGTPLLMPTADGGFITHFPSGSGSLVVRGWLDGSTQVIEFTDQVRAVDPSGRLYFSDGKTFVRVDPFEDRSTRWDGRRETQDDGSVTFPGLEDFVLANRPAWATSPESFADAVSGRPQVNETRTVEAVQLSEFGWSVTVTTGNYFDDSVFAGRTIFDVRRRDDGLFRVESATSSVVCQPGRGHQDFSNELCV